MSNMTDYLENKLVDQLFRGVAYTFPTTLYVALFTTAPGETGGGVEVSTSGTAYARVAITNSTANWAATNGAGTTTNPSSGTTGQTSNNGAVTFPAPTGTNWGTIQAFGIFDASTAGNLLIYGNLTTPKTVNAGDAAPSFAAGALQITLA